MILILVQYKLGYIGYYSNENLVEILKWEIQIKLLFDVLQSWLESSVGEVWLKMDVLITKRRLCFGD
jgi:hypothetical protein